MHSWRQPWRRLEDTVRDPVAWSDLIQLVKTVVAAVVAWVLAAQVFGLPQAFLAPWSALLVVHATVYRTLSRGLRQVTGTVVGVLLAWMAGNLLGVTMVALVVLLVIGMLIGSVRWFREETTVVAATALLVLTAGVSTQDQMLVERLYDTGIGLAVGLLVNLVVWPPLRDTSAARAIDLVDDAVAELLSDMASDIARGCDAHAVAGWVDRSAQIDADIDHAWSLVRQARESSRLNPRRAAIGIRTSSGFEELLSDNEQAVAEVRSMARTIGRATGHLQEWEPPFRDRWLALLQEAADAIGAPDAGRVSQVRAGLEELAEELSDENLSARHWPEYGALITNLRNVVTSMDRVAEQNPVTVARYHYRRRLLRG